MTEEVFKVRFTQDGAKEIVRSFDDMIRSADSAEDAAARLVKATNEVRRSADPAQRAYDNLARSLHTLSRAEQAGIIGIQERIKLQDKLTATSAASLRPVSTLVSKIGEETRAWSASNVQRQATLRTLGQVEAMMRRGIAVTDQERAAIQQANTAFFQKKEALRQMAQQEDAAARAAKKAADEQIAAANKVERENAQLLASFEQTYRNSGTIVESAVSKRNAALQQATAAERAGIITSQQLADVEGRLSRQYAEQIDPLQRIERLQRERVGYMAGLFQQGRQLAQVNRDLVRLDAQGVQLDMARVASLRAHAKQADRLQDAYEGLNRAKTLFGTVLGGVGLGIAASFVTRTLDDVTMLNNKLRLVSSSQENANRLFAESVGIANRSRSSLEDVVTAYSRIARSTKDIGLSQSDALRITESVTKAFKISGASIQEASASAVQFGQALASNRLGGDELRSILEQAPRLSQAVVDGINLMNRQDPSQLPKKLRDEIAKTGKLSIGSLRDVAKQGLLTSDVVAKAVLSQTSAIDTEFKRTVPTISESFVVLKNAWMSFLNDFNKGTGAAGAISRAIMFVADNLETILNIAIPLGGTLAGMWAFSQLQKFLNFVTGLPAAFTASQAAINSNVGVLNSENTALAANTELQIANAAARRGVGAAAAQQATTVAAGGVAGAAGGLASAQTAANLSSGAAAAAAMRAQLTGAATAAGATAARTGVLAGLFNTLKGGAGAIAGGLTGIVGKLGLIGAAIGLATSLWLTFKDSIKLANDQLLMYAEGTTTKAIRGNITLGDVASGVFRTLTGQASELTQAQIAGQDNATANGVSRARELSDEEKKAAQDALDAKAQAAVSSMSVYDQMSEGIVKSTARWVGDFVTGAVYIGQTFSNIMQAIGSIAQSIFNSIANKIASIYNTVLLPIINKASEFGIGKGGTALNADRSIVDVGAQFNAADLAAQRAAVLAGARTREQTAQSILAAAGNRERRGALGGLDGAGTPSITNSGDKGKKKKGADEAKKLASAYQQLRDELDPLAKITDDYNKDQETLNKALAAGLLTTERHADLMARLKLRYEEASDPLGKYIKETQQESAILALNASDRELATAIMEREKEFREKLRRELTDDEKARIRENETMRINTQRRTEMTDSIAEAARQREIERGQIGLSAQEIEAENRARATLGDALKNNVEGAQDAFEKQKALELQFIRERDAAKRMVDIYEGLTGAQRAFAQDSNALTGLLNRNVITTQQYNRELRALTMNVLSLETSANAGFQRALINLKNQTEDLASATQTAFENAFNSIEEGFVGVFKGAEFSAQDFFANIAGDAARIFYRGAIDPLVSNLGKSLGIPGFDSKTTGLTDQQIQANNVYINGLSLGSLLTGGASGAPGLGGAPMAGASAGLMPTTGSAVDFNPMVSSAQSAAGQINSIFAASSQAAQGNYMGLFNLFGQGVQQMVTQTVASNSAISAANTTMAATDTATHVAAETAKTTATVAGTTARTAAETTAAATSKTLTISTALMEIGANAVKAATGAYAALASIPYVGPFIAPAAAAAALYGVYALGKKMFSAEQGFGSVPYDGAVTELHKEEMVLPAKYANPLRDQLTSGGGMGSDQAPPEVNIDQKVVNVFDPAAMLDALQTNAGRRVLLNFVQSNPEAIKRALS